MRSPIEQMGLFSCLKPSQLYSNCVGNLRQRGDTMAQKYTPFGHYMLYKRGNRWHYYYYEGQKRVRKSTGKARKSEALAVISDLMEARDKSEKSCREYAEPFSFGRPAQGLSAGAVQNLYSVHEGSDLLFWKHTNPLACLHPNRSGMLWSLIGDRRQWKSVQKLEFPRNSFSPILTTSGHL